jgi:hypothetical protein
MVLTRFGTLRVVPELVSEVLRLWEAFLSSWVCFAYQLSIFPEGMKRPTGLAVSLAPFLLRK